MKKHLTTLMALTAALAMPLTAMAQDAAQSISPADIFGSSANSSDAAPAQDDSAKAEENSAPAEDAAPAQAAAESSSDNAAQDNTTIDNSNAAQSADNSEPAPADTPANADDSAKSDAEPAVAENNDAKPKDASKDDVKDKEDDKGWGVNAVISFDLGLGAFTKHEYARRIRSRFGMEIGGFYTIPVIDVDIHAKTGFTQWMSKAGGSNGQYEFRWADSEIGLSRNIWEYKKGDFAVTFDADLSFVLPTSTASINAKLYTTIAPSLAVGLKLSKFSFGYGITYGHSFIKYTSLTFNPSEVDILSRSAGVELVNNNNIASGGILNEIELANQFAVGYQFIKQLSVGFAFVDSWTYDNGTNTLDDEFVSPNAKVGRGHSQLSVGAVALTYTPIKYASITLSMTSTQPWKTADNKTLRFPWFDTVSPSKNFTKFMLSATFQY